MSALTGVSSLARPLAVSGAPVVGSLALDAVLDDPRVLLDLVEWDSFLRVKYQKL